jgi:hypothetical protein
MAQAIKITPKQQELVNQMRERALSLVQLIDKYKPYSDGFVYDLLDYLDTDIEKLHSLKEAAWNTIPMDDLDAEKEG